MGTRTSRINALRGFLREFGIAIPLGARTGLETISRVLADPGTAVPALIRGTMALLVDEIRLLEARIGQLERELSELARAACALANKLARICYATLRDKERFDEKQSLTKKLNRQAFVMPA